MLVDQAAEACAALCPRCRPVGDRRLDAQRVSRLLIPAVQPPRAIPKGMRTPYRAATASTDRVDAADHRITDVRGRRGRQTGPGDEADGDTEPAA